MPLSAWAFALLSAVLFGVGLNLAQAGLRYLPSQLGAVVSIPTAGTLFWLTAPLTVSLVGWRWDAVALFAATGLFYPALITTLTFESTRAIGPALTAAFGNLAPLYAVVAGLVLLGEALGGWQVAGVAALLAGATVLTTRGQLKLDGVALSPWLLLLPLTASLLRGIGQPILKIGFQWWNNPRVATLMCYLMSAIMAVSLGLWRSRGTDARFTRKGVAWFMSVGLANGIATWAGIEAVSRGPVSLVAPVVATYPLFTLAIARFLSRDHGITRQQTIGIALTVLGVMLLLAG